MSKPTDEDEEVWCHTVPAAYRERIEERMRAEVVAERARADAIERERDLAIAHDRQPYPTAWAYDQACKALTAAKARADSAEAKVRELEEKIEIVRQDI